MSDIVERARELVPRCTFAIVRRTITELADEVERARQADHHPGLCYHCTRCADADDSQQEALREELERERRAHHVTITAFNREQSSRLAYQRSVDGWRQRAEIAEAEVRRWQRDLPALADRALAPKHQ